MNRELSKGCEAATRKSLRRRLHWLSRTPFHPQWLMGLRRVDPELSNCTGNILDVGSADGWLRSLLHPLANYVALDYPTTAIGLYRTRPDVFGNAAKLPFLTNSFDAVACYEVLEHVRDPEEVMVEISRVLKPGGVAELSMPFLYPVHDAPHDYQRWTQHGWERSAMRSGLLIEKLEPQNHPIAAAAVLTSLALAAPLQDAKRTTNFLLLPFAAVTIAAINLAAWLGIHVWPDWPGMTTGHRILLRKRS